MWIELCVFFALARVLTCTENARITVTRSFNRPTTTTTKTPPSLELSNSVLTYLPPRYDIKNPNITIGAIFDMTFPRGIPNPLGLVYMLGATCQMIEINEGRSSIPLKGTMNLLSFNVETNITQTYYTGMQLLRTNLYFDGNQTGGSSRVRASPYPSIGAVIGSGSYDEFFGIAPFFNGFEIPTVGYGDSTSRQQLTSSSFLEAIEEFLSVFTLSDTTGPSLTTALFDLYKSFNWTLSTVLFEENNFGFLGELSLQSFNNLFPTLNTTCGSSLGFNVTQNEIILKNFVSCVKRVDTLNVVLLWMSFESAYRVIQYLNTVGGGDLTFVIIFRAANNRIPVYGDPSVLKSAIYFASDIHVEATKASMTECVKLTMEGRNPIAGMKERLTNLLQTYENCQAALPDDADGNCTLNSVKNRNGACKCDVIKLLTSTNNLAQYAFSADAISTIAHGLSLLQNNCSYLEETSLVSRFLDFCKMTDFTPAVLSAAMKRVNFTGLSGPISFGPLLNGRQEADFLVYQFNENAEPVPIGTFTNQQIHIDYSAVYFPDGKIPTSEIVIDIPDLSNAFVAVFFAVMCVLIGIVLAIAVFVVVYWDHRLLRRDSPMFLLLILLGVLLVAVSGIIMAVGLTTSTLCILTDAFLVLGLTLIIANLLAKNWRIYRIFSNSSAYALRISDVDLMLFNIVLLTLTLIQLFVYSYAGGAVRPVVFWSEENRFYAYANCVCPSEGFQLARVILWYVYFGILFVATAVLGFLTRKVRYGYNESGVIATIVYIYICIGIVFIPLYYTQGSSADSQQTRVVLHSVALAVLMFATLTILFAPKIVRILRYERRHKRRQERQASAGASAGVGVDAGAGVGAGAGAGLNDSVARRMTGPWAVGE